MSPVIVPLEVMRKCVAGVLMLDPWFEFDSRGNLVDFTITEMEDQGGAASALADDARKFLLANPTDTAATRRSL